MTIHIRKVFSSKSSKKGRSSNFTQLHDDTDPYAVHSTDPEDIETTKNKALEEKRRALEEKRAREANEFLAKYGFGGANGFGGHAMPGLR